MKREVPDKVRRIQELRRSNSATPIKNKKAYDRNSVKAEIREEDNK